MLKYIKLNVTFVLYECETWSVTQREEHRLRVCKNRELRRIFGPRREEVAGDWGRLHKELHNFYSSPYVIKVIKSKRMRWVKYVACMGR